MIASDFLERLTRRLDRIDPKSLQTYTLDLIKEREFLMALFDQIQEGVIVFGKNSEIIFLNRRANHILNLSAEEGTKLALSKAFQDEPLRTLVTDALKNKTELFHEELETLSPRPMILRISLFFTSPKSSNFAILLLENISQNEFGLREKFKSENLETMMGLAAGIAHEIGNPLNSLTIHLKLLSQTLKKLEFKEKTKAQESLNVIQEEAQRLDSIVRNFLKAIRRKPLQFELMQVNDLLSKSISFLKPELKENKIKIEEDFDPKLPEFLLDSDRLQQVFLNIIKNAMHAMAHGGAVKISTQLKGNLCFIQFKDTGVGISQEELPKIFDAYYTTKEEGSGLGLMIVHQIIREHGGRIEVLSKINTGTTFGIVLPIRKEKLRLPEPEKG
jgi:signal transduction histidine kinase